MRRRLQEADWADLGIRLTAYATYRWRTRQMWEIAAGKTPEDVARKAIVKVLDGTRTSEPQRGPLLPFLQGIVDSLMSLEGVSKMANYAYGKRVLYIDQETWVVLVSDVYDRQGALWKVWLNMFRARP